MRQFCRTIPRLVLSALLILAAIKTTEATTAVMVADTDLIVNSRIIVSGEVVSVTSAWDRFGSMAWTYVEVRVDQVLKGNLNEQTIVLKQLGGTIGETGIRVFGQPGFAERERVLMYLNTAPDGSLHSAHNFMGKFGIIKDASGAEYVERSIDAREVDLMSQASADDVTNRASLQGYLRTIRRTLRQQAARVAEVDAQQSSRPIVAIPKEFSSIDKGLGNVSPAFALFGPAIRWMEPDAGQPVRYFVNPNSSPVAGGAAAEIARAMSAWPTQSGASVQLQVAGQTANCGIAYDNINTISFGDCLGQLDPPIGCAGTVALTAISWIQDSKIIGGTSFNKLLEADTVFNDGMNCFLSTSANLAEVACHELGHSLGLGHSSDPAAMMWATAHGRGRDATLSDDDKSGILSIYPSSSGNPPPPPPVPVLPLSITTAGLIDGVEGLRYTVNLLATGGTQPYRWAVVGGSLPAGLSFSPNGTVDGFPNFAGSYAFVAQVIDSSNPLRQDAKWFSISIRPSGSGVFPTVTGIKVKGKKKMWVFGENFRADSLILINGIEFEPRSFSVGELLAKGKLNLGPTGTNAVVVVNTNNRSAPFIF